MKGPVRANEEEDNQISYGINVKNTSSVMQSILFPNNLLSRADRGKAEVDRTKFEQ